MSVTRKHSGPRMSQIVVHGNTVYLAGQVAQEAPGASVGDQTRDILQRIDQYLAEAGTDKSKALTATIWLTTMDTFAEMNEVYARHFGEHRPARAAVQAAALPKFCDVEIECVARVATP